MEHGILQTPSSPKLTVRSTSNRLPKVGDVVVVMWDGYGDVQEWYRGKLMKQRGRRHFYFDIVYDDGDKQTQDLNEEHWHFAKDSENCFEPGEVEELRRELAECSYKAKLKKRPCNQNSRNIRDNVEKRRRLKPIEYNKPTWNVFETDNNDDFKTLNALASASVEDISVTKKGQGEKCVVPVLEGIEYIRKCNRNQNETSIDDLDSPVSVSYSGDNHGVDNIRSSNFSVDESELEKICDISLHQVNNVFPYKKRKVVRLG